MSNGKDTRIGKTIGNKYKILKKIGEGSFFEVYQAEYLGNYFAIKFGKSNLVKNIFENLSGLACQDIPYIREVSITDQESYIVMQLFGKDLSKFLKPSKKFSIKTTAMIGIQILHILQIIHEAGIAHRNLGGANFVIGYGELEKRIFLIDFSLAKKFKDEKGNLIPMISNAGFCGIQKYGSINSLNSLTQCRRDDLESLGYILVEFLKGKLPWAGKTGKTKEEKQSLAKFKQSISVEELCENLPIQMVNYMKYCRNLKYEDIPDYEMLKQLFLDMIKKNNEVFDYVYDWSEIKNNTNVINYAEIEDLKSQLIQKDKIISELNDKIKKIGNTNAVGMVDTIQKLQKELDSLKSAIKISSNNVIAVHFLSPDSNINISFTCKLTDKFADIERKLVEKFPKLEEFNCSYLVNGINVRRYKNLLENQIKEDGTKIIVIYNDESC